MQNFEHVDGVQDGLRTVWMPKFSFARSRCEARGLRCSIEDFSAGRTILMDQEYADYLSSDAWKLKRKQRLELSNFRCSACATKKRLEVHHLTYARIFNEDMADLLPLCDQHHESAEKLIADGLISRHGSVLFLATETIRLIVTRKPSKASNKFGARTETTNTIQEDLLNETWFIDALRMKRKHFKRACRRKFAGNPRMCAIMANCFVLFNRGKGLNGK